MSRNELENMIQNTEEPNNVVKNMGAQNDNIDYVLPKFGEENSQLSERRRKNERTIEWTEDEWHAEPSDVFGNGQASLECSINQKFYVNWLCIFAKNQNREKADAIR